VAVVVDPIQSVKGKVVIDAFRLINPQTMMLGQEPRQTTSNLGHLNKPSIQVCCSNPFSFLTCILFFGGTYFAIRFISSDLSMSPLFRH
jgi:hypothetical protein